MPSSSKFTYLQENLFQKLADDQDFFEDFIIEKYTKIFQYYNLKIVLDKSFIKEVYHLWVRDRKVVVQRSKETISQPNHFKDAGMLSYWLKRLSPVSTIETLDENAEFKEIFKNLPPETQEALPDAVWTTSGHLFSSSDDKTEFSASSDEAKDDEELFKLIIGYPREYPAFSICFRICSFIESRRNKTVERQAHQFNLDEPFLRDICILYREKHTSPYSLSYIYRALFFEFPKID